MIENAGASHNLKCNSERFPELSLIEKSPLAFMMPSVSKKSFSGNQLAFDSVSPSYNSLKILEIILSFGYNFLILPDMHSSPRNQPLQVMLASMIDTVH